MENGQGRHGPEQPTIERSTKIIRELLNNTSSVAILNIEDDHPNNNHPLRIQAKSKMQSLQSTETANAMALLLSGIGTFKDGEKIRAAQFLFSHLDFLKVDPDKLKEAFTAAITDQTSVDNIHAVIKTGEATAPHLLDNDTKLAMLRGIHNIQIKLPEDSLTEDIKAHIEQAKKSIPVQEPELIFDVSRLTELTESDMRMIIAHHQGIPHKKIAENEGLKPSSVSTRLNRLRGKGVPVKRRPNKSQNPME
jgi:hypothetical protein